MKSIIVKVVRNYTREDYRVSSEGHRVSQRVTACHSVSQKAKAFCWKSVNGGLEPSEHHRGV